MSNPVTIKVLRSGIVLILDPNIPFSKLKEDILRNFRESAAFMGSRRTGLVIKNRKLSVSEEAEVIRIISDTTQLTIVCVLEDDPELENVMHRYLETGPDEAMKQWQEKLEEKELALEKRMRDIREREHFIEKQFKIRQDQIMDQKNSLTKTILQMKEVLAGDVGQIYNGDVRSGQNLKSKYSMIIMGNVNPGGRVTSDGCIFIMGSLMGEAVAGDSGNQDAFIMAMDFHPMQIRIAGRIAVSPDVEPGRNGWKLRRNHKEKINVEEQGPQVAYIRDGKMGRSSYDDDFLLYNRYYKRSD